jgi:hypothetical protein
LLEGMYAHPPFITMLNRIIRRGLQAPSWLRPLLGFVLFWLLPLAACVLTMALLDSHLAPRGVRALIDLSVAGAASALAYGLVSAFVYVRSSLRPWVLAFAASSVFFISLALLSASEVNTFARWEFAVAIIVGGTALGGAILRALR